MTDLRNPALYAEPTEDTGATDHDAVTASGVRSLVAVPTLAAVCAMTAASATRSSSRDLGRRVARSGRRATDATTSALSTAADGCRIVLDRSLRATSGGASACRATGSGLLDRCRSLAGTPSIRS